MARVAGRAEVFDAYARSAHGPVARGDQVDGRTVAGFTFDPHPVSGAPGDRLLLDGDHRLTGPPDRTVPAAEDESVRIIRSGPSPVDSLSGDAIAAAPPHLRAGFERVVVSMESGGRFVEALLDALAARHHTTWLVGGAVRDLLRDGEDARVNDLDFTGTAGPGELTELAEDRMLRRHDLGDVDCRVSPRLVWSVAPAEFPPDRLMEYRPLALDEFAFPAYGGDLAADAVTRDLTVNSLYYDHRRNATADPTGQGLRDLEAAPRVLAVGYEGDDPVAQACVILRCLKFRLRWPEADTARAAKWVGALPADLTGRIPADGWPRVRAARESCVPVGDRGERESAIAHEFGPAAASLVRTIQERTG
ncbi:MULTISPECIES: hypothetical protein [unclassified Streptomyces]|uniref:hypothetical protein n=1 Tax=unclassified Streptomyces TaxID=2593676 RepID=UPI000AC48526|nr:hypothetical protein [Streptomyces sp. CB02058]